MKQEVVELKLQGYCCSQILMELGLRHLGKDNPDLIAAMAGLCNGLWQGKVCGILSAAICLLYLADADATARFNGNAFHEWFEDAFGSVECDALMENNPINRIEKCPAMLEASYMKICELMEWED